MNVKTLLPYLKRFTKETIIAPLLKLFEVALELLVPIIVAGIIDVGIANGDKGYVFTMCGVLVLLGALGLAFALTAQYFAAKAAVGFSGAVRSALFDKILSLSAKDTEKLGASALITGMTGDVNQVQTGLNLTLRLLLRSPVVVFGAAAMAYAVDKDSSAPFLISIPILFLLVFVIMLYGIPLFMKVQKKLEKTVLLTRENLSGARVVRGFNISEKEKEGFGKANREHSRAKIVSGAVSSLLNPMTFVVVNIAIIALLSNSADFVNKGELKQGEVVALYNFMALILTELIKFADLVINITKSISSAKRIGTVLKITPSVSYGELEIDTDSDYAIEFNNVTLNYTEDAEPALKGIDLKITKGKKVGVIGVTGSGKSSLVSLISRLYDPTHGSVSLFGKDIKEYTQSSIFTSVGFARQTSDLYSGSIRDNLKMRKADLSEEEIAEVLEISQSAEFVKKLDEGADFVLEEKGKNLSGGQKQRLNIARALVGSPPIVILDNSTSALDYLTASRLNSALERLPEDTTVISVSQRVNAVSDCDIIAVLYEGELKGVGSHAELFESCAEYREICVSQGYGKGGAEI